MRFSRDGKDIGACDEGIEEVHAPAGKLLAHILKLFGKTRRKTYQLRT
jgi:hypothetical protein